MKPTVRHGQQATVLGTECKSAGVHCVLCGTFFELVAGDEVAMFSNGAECYYGCHRCIKLLVEAVLTVRREAESQDRGGIQDQ